MIDRMQTIPVLVTLRFTDDQLATLRSLSPRVQVEQRVVTRDAQLADVLDPSIVVLYAGGADFPLAATPHLRWIQLHNAGVEHVYATEAWRSDIPITSMTGIHAVPIAEYTIGLMLAWAHHVPRMLAYQARAEWATNRWANFVPRELRGMTLGLVGYGAIGREVARLGQAMGMRVLATKRVTSDPQYHGWRLKGTGDPNGTIPSRYYPPDAISDMLVLSDYVVVSTPLTPATRELIGREEIAAMRPDAFLVNVARGGVIDQAALIEALRAGRLGGAGLDVFEPEPLPADSPLWGMENVIISPHISGFTPRYDDWAADVFAHNLRRFLDNDPLLNLVDRKRGY